MRRYRKIRLDSIVSAVSNRYLEAQCDVTPLMRLAGVEGLKRPNLRQELHICHRFCERWVASPNPCAIATQEYTNGMRVESQENFRFLNELFPFKRREEFLALFAAKLSDAASAL